MKSEEKNFEFDIEGLPIPDWSEISDNWIYGEELTKPLNVLIKSINNFLHSLFSPNKDGEEDVVLGHTPNIKNSEYSIYQLNENLSVFSVKHSSCDSFLSDYQWGLLEQVKTGLSTIQKDILDDIDPSDLLIDKSWLEYMERRQKGIRTMDEWDAFVGGIPEPNYTSISQSPFHMLKARCFFLGNVLENAFRKYPFSKEKMDLLRSLSYLLYEKVETLDSIIENETIKVFGIKLTTIMKELKITQAELANHLGVSRAAVNDWCKGKKKPSLEKIITIATFLNTSTDYLLRPEVEMISYEENFMLKHYGLTSKSIGMLKEIKNQQHIIDTLNILISNYKAMEQDENMDILSGLANYLNPYYMAYVVSDDTIMELMNRASNADSLEDIRKCVFDFCDSLDPNSTTEFEKLRELESILLRAKEKLFFKNLDFKDLNAD